MSKYFTIDTLKAMYNSANKVNLMYAGAGYYVGAHYAAKVAAYVVKFLAN